MTYVEKMAITIRGGKTIKRAEDLVERIIADTKNACKEVLYGEGPAVYEAIDRAEVKEQEK